SAYKFYPCGSFSYDIQTQGKDIFLKLYDGCSGVHSNVMDSYIYSEKNRPQTEEILSGYADRFHLVYTDFKPVCKPVSSYRVRFLRSVAVAAVIAAAVVLYYVIAMPFVFIGDRIIKTNSEYALFNIYGSVSSQIWSFDLPSKAYRTEDSSTYIDSKDTKKFKYMPNLKHISLYGNDIDDLSEIGKLTQLETLCFGNDGEFSDPDDYSPLKNLVNLKVFAGLGLENFNDYSVFENMDDLKHLELSCAEVSSEGTEIICSRNGLEKLNLYKCTIENYEKLSGCKNLKMLCLSRTNITDIDFADNFQDLELLNISYTDVTDLNPLRSLDKLEYLYIDGIETEDFSVLTELPSIQYVKGNNIPEEIKTELEENGIKFY
ncbi:MAG: leucine-rich repeat domain-containing protein, partial [Oscillospiraceae bacterium]